MLAVIRGAGDIASGIALRLFHSGFRIAMTETEHPTAIRRTVCFSEAVRLGSTEVEKVRAELCRSTQDAEICMLKGLIAVLIDENGSCLKSLLPGCVVDARLAKRNIDTGMDDAPVVIGVGPGFTAGEDCHAVIETKRGHYLGRAIYAGSAAENTGIPGDIGGYTMERLLCAPCEGFIRNGLEIGTKVTAGQICAFVGDTPITAQIDGVLRGMLPDGTRVHAGMKSGDIDPIGIYEHCLCVSDKALAVGGGVLEAILHLSHAIEKP